MAGIHRSHLALACFPIADLSETQKHQQGETGSALADSRLDQRSECIDIALVDKTCGRIDIQTTEMIYLAQADLKNAEIALQILLLVDHQLQPAALDRGNAIAGNIEASGKDIAGFLVGGLQEGLDGARYVAVIGDDHL